MFIVQGNTQEKAYEKAGYKPIAQSAHNLLKNTEVKQRIMELRREERLKAGITRESMAQEFAELRDAAAAAGQHGAAMRGAECIAKLYGLFVDKRMIGVARLDSMSEAELLDFLGGEPDDAELEDLADDTPQLTAEVIDDNATPDATHDDGAAEESSDNNGLADSGN